MTTSGVGKDQRTLLAWIGLLLTAWVMVSPARAQERWAALSLIGDRMNLVYARMETGTRNNPNYVKALPMTDDVLDRLVLRAVVSASIPGKPEVLALGLRDPRYYQAQEKLLASEGKALLDGLLKAVEAQTVTHILLVTRARSEAMFRVREGHIGTGSVEGLGFYVDRATSLQREETGERDRGYLAPFVHYRLMLFDIARSAVVAEARVAASRTYLVAGSGESDPWDVVSAQQKVDDLEQLLNQHTGDALKRLVAARARG